MRVHNGSLPLSKVSKLFHIHRLRFDGEVIYSLSAICAVKKRDGESDIQKINLSVRRQHTAWWEAQYHFAPQSTENPSYGIPPDSESYHIKTGLATVGFYVLGFLGFRFLAFLKI